MSLLYKNSRKKHSQDIREDSKQCPIYVKHRLAKVEEQRRVLMSLCDKDYDSSEEMFTARFNSVRQRDTDPKDPSQRGSKEKAKQDDNTSAHENKKRNVLFVEAKKRKVSKSSDHDTIKNSQNTSKHSSNSKVTESDPNQQWIKSSNHKSSSNANRSRGNTTKGKGLAINGSDPEEEKESITTKEKTYKTLATISQTFASIHKDDGESSSDKEFQKTKLIHNNRQRGRTLSDSKAEHLESNKSDCSSVMQTSSRTQINKERSLLFKLHMVKILNGFKEVCSEYELQMERVKWKYLKKDLKYEEVATNIVNKTKGMINKLQMEVNAKELELTNFYEKWLENCTEEDIEDDDTSTSENEISEPKSFKEKSDNSRNESMDEDKISRCDSTDIFSESGIKVGRNEIRKNKTAVDARGDKVEKEAVNNDSSNEVEYLEEMFDSPVLGSNRGTAKSTKMSKKLSTPQNETDNTNDKVSEECEEHEQSIKSVASNDSKSSIDDMFEETIENEESSVTQKENEKKKKNVKEKEKGKEQMKGNEKEKDEENGNENDKEKGNRNDKEKENENDKEKENRNDKEKENENAKEKENRNDKEKENENDKEKEKEKDNEYDSDKRATVESNLNKDTNSSEIEKAKNEDSSDNDSVANEMECSTDPVSHKKILKLEAEIIEVLEDDKSEMSDDICRELEKLAKKAILDSDSDISMNEESTTNTSAKFSVKRITREEQSSESEKEETAKEKNTITKKSLATDGSTDNEKEITKGKKRAIRDLNLDESSDLSSVKEKEHDSDDISDEARARATLLATSNSESLSSDNSSKLQELKSDSSSCSFFGKRKKRVEIVLLKDNVPVLNQNDGQRVTRQKKRYDLKSDEKLQKPCIVNVERLSEEVLQKYEDALEKSREHLNSKTIKNLIDLNKLERNYKKSSDSPRSSLKARIRPAKEKEDSLLDHLNRVENGECVESSKDSDLENNIEVEKLRIQSNAELMSESDKFTKQLLLHSSDSDEPQKLVLESESNEEENDKSQKPKDDTKPSTPKEKKEPNDENDGKSSWRRDKLLTMKLSTTSDDSDAEGEKFLKKQKNLREKEEDDDTDNPDIKITKVKRTTRRFRRKIMDSDSDVERIQLDSESDSSAKSKSNEDADTDVSVGKQKRIRKRKTRKSSGTDTSIEEKKSKSKRRRIKKVASDSDDDSDNLLNSQGTPGSKGRKNIRRVMKDKLVTDDTKQAAKEEEERLKRIAERQKLYNEMYEARLASEERVDKLVLDFDPETKEELLSVHPELVKCLKPHQAQGIKFMWDASFESLERIKSSKGTGCIIAHCMGLGKTLQVVTLTHTLLMHEETGIKTVMVVCPLSTVLNWVNEYEKWLKDINDGSIEIYKLTKLKKNIERKHELECWQRTGGVLIIGYEMYRNLCGASKNMRKNMKEAILQYLIDPGPDMVVCDEGHLLKNEGSALSKTMTRIKTLRRIVLTGTPLQNNLIEYHCMVQFVKPNLLGTRKEFLNRFANPITNGQFDDSTENDVKLMKKRAYVLHKMLKGCVQRFDYSVLTPFLPPKQEYVIFVSLTDVQIKLYRYYLDNFARKHQRAGGSLFVDFQALQRIWTHPLVLRLNSERMEKLNDNKFSSSESEGSLKDFINDNSDSDTTSSKSTTSEDEDVQSNKSNINTRNTTKSNDDDIEIISKPEEKDEKKDPDWWKQFVEPEHFDDMTMSSKLILLFNILQECEKIGDKLLVFSQSLSSLKLIEEFLKQVDDETQNNTASKKINGHSGSWSLGLDYFRLDGTTPPENRNMWCRIFNRSTNTRARLFLISTRAGGLGINLTAANRVIIFDASWNPSHDVQSIFRIYRFGQKKPCYVYRFLAAGTMEEKIYNRQVTKLSLSCRVIDEQQIGRHYSNNNLNELYTFEPSVLSEDKPTLNLPKDRLLAETFLKHRKYVENYHEHDSLLENKVEEELNEEERKQAWLEYEEEKKGPPRALLYPTMAPISYNIIQKQYNPSMAFNMSMDYEKIGELIRKDHPHIGSQYQQLLTTKVIQDMYTYWERQTLHSTNQVINQPQLASQMVNPVTVPRTIQNTNTADSSKRTKETLPDDDVVEVTSTIETSKDKNQEE